jgi:hypothetical protein
LIIDIIVVVRIDGSMFSDSDGYVEGCIDDDGKISMDSIGDDGKSSGSGIGDESKGMGCSDRKGKEGLKICNK